MTPPSLPEPPMSGADHFHTAEVHAVCARLQLAPVKDETAKGRADRLAQFDGHMTMAEFHRGMAATLVAACALPGVDSTTDEVASWSIFFAQRLRAGQEAGVSPDDAPTSDK